MFVKMVTPHEPLPAHFALETLLPSVCPIVPLQLVGTSEPLPTKRPHADEWSLASVPAKVSTQVRGLPIHLATTMIVANVSFLLRSAVGVNRPGVDTHSTVGAGAGYPLNSFGLDGKVVHEEVCLGRLEDSTGLPLRMKLDQGA